MLIALPEGGGTADGDVVTGDGWTVRLEQMEDHELGSLRIEQVLVTMEGDLQKLLTFFEPKLLRAGG